MYILLIGVFTLFLALFSCFYKEEGKDFVGIRQFVRTNTKPVHIRLIMYGLFCFGLYAFFTNSPYYLLLPIFIAFVYLPMLLIKEIGMESAHQFFGYYFLFLALTTQTPDVTLFFIAFGGLVVCYLLYKGGDTSE